MPQVCNESGIDKANGCCRIGGPSWLQCSLRQRPSWSRRPGANGTCRQPHNRTGQSACRCSGWPCATGGYVAQPQLWSQWRTCLQSNGWRSHWRLRRTAFHHRRKIGLEPQSRPTGTGRLRRKSERAKAEVAQFRAHPLLSGSRRSVADSSPRRSCKLG